MNCIYKACHRSHNCRIKDVAHNCSIHRRYLKVLKGEKIPIDSFIIDDEEAIKKYVNSIKREHPELAEKAEKNARDVLKSINH